MDDIQTQAVDQQKFVFNVFTGNFDAVLEFNTDRIITHSLNAAGMPFADGIASLDRLSPLVVIDNNGNVVST